MFKKSLFALALALCAVASLQAQPPRRGGQDGMPFPMFDRIKLSSMFGDNLENGDFKEGDWVVEENGEVVSPGYGEIWTKRKYGSFVCEFEFNAETEANAGFIIHASDKKDWVPNAIEVQLLGDSGKEAALHGCAAFYGYKTPMQNLTKPAGEWNKMKVVAWGRNIFVFMNGKMVNYMNTAAWTDTDKSPEGTEVYEKFRGKSLASQEPYGFIGFQGKHSDTIIHYRNIKFAPISAPMAAEGGEWTSLFGEKLEKAEFDSEVWSVDDQGVLRPAKDEMIWTKEKYDNFALKFEFQTSKDANSGVIVQCTDKENWIPNAFEVQVYDSYEQGNGLDQCGAIYGRCPTMFNVCKAPGEWNSMIIVCMGSMIEVFLNDELITFMPKRMWTSADTNPDGSKVFEWLVNKAPSETENSGFIGIQGLHAGKPVAYRNIMVKKLPRMPRRERGR